MKDAVGFFSALQERMRSFGCDDRSREVIARACRVNGWFSPEDILRAVEAIRDEMLSRERLDAWLSHYPATPVASSKRVLVVMAGNIPLVGFFDLLCVLASGHRCVVKLSTKDTPLMEYVIDLMRDVDPFVSVELYRDDLSIDAVIATGSNNACRHFQGRYAGIPSLLRGSRQSVAVLSGNETPEQLKGLADDIWAYSGLGCRNVSLVFVPRGCEVELNVPCVNNKYVNNYRQTKALLEMTGQPFTDLGRAVVVEQQLFPSSLSEIVVYHYDAIGEVADWLAAHDEELQCVVTECLPHNRSTAFGCAQKPALTDYPDDKDVMEFLLSLN